MPTAAERLLSEAFLGNHPAEAAHVLERLPAADAASLLDGVPPEIAADVVARMAPDAAAAGLDALESEAAAAVVSRLPPRTAASLGRRMAPARLDALLARVPSAVAGPVVALLRHPPDTAGALLDPHAFALTEDTRVEDARAELPRAGVHASDYLWIVRDGRTLAGVVPLAQLLRARGEQALGEIVRPAPSLSAHADRRMILAHPGWREFHALPVVDDGGGFLGVVPYETFRQLETEPSDQRPRTVLADVLTLAEAYLVGMTELLKGLAGPSGRRGAPDGF